MHSGLRSTKEPIRHRTMRIDLSEGLYRHVVLVYVLVTLGWTCFLRKLLMYSLEGVCFQTRCEQRRYAQNCPRGASLGDEAEKRRGDDPAISRCRT